jgi:P-type Ca2+ transporter type 2A
MFIFDQSNSNDIQIEQFEITGSTYEPKGDILYNGSKFNCSEKTGLMELAECAAMCNDSALDFNEVRCLSHLSHVLTSTCCTIVFV